MNLAPSWIQIMIQFGQALSTNAYRTARYRLGTSGQPMVSNGLLSWNAVPLFGRATNLALCYRASRLVT
jgi:hypothetical protein